jgi:hypothetical protein
VALGHTHHLHTPMMGMAEGHLVAKKPLHPSYESSKDLFLRHHLDIFIKHQ